MLLAKSLDGVRATALRSTLRFELPRRIFSDCAARLIFSFTLFAALYLPLALRWPGTLLWIGPLVFGYPHLVASYRFLQPRHRIARMKPFVCFAILTVTSLLLHGLAERFNWVGELPFGAWELAVATATAILVTRTYLATLICGVGGALLWRFAWQEPLAFAAFALLFHNWVAFFVWIRKARGGRSRAAAVAATAIFALIHVAVFSSQIHAPLSREATNTSGLLAPWTRDPSTWYRMLVLYTFGLSMHYFVWLKAIPECGQRFPNSWRRSGELLRKDLGTSGLALAGIIAAAGLGAWIWDADLGAKMYFQAALLHGWLELMFLGAVLGPTRNQVLSQSKIT